MAGDEPMYLVALKSVSEERFCSFFVGNGKLVPGDLSILCGSGNEQRLLINSNNSNHILAWDWTGNADNLHLPRRWVEDALSTI
jgi:hypothetical protein